MHHQDILEDNQIFEPPFSTLAWDNCKTTGYFSGTIAGTIPGVVLGAFSLFLCVPPERMFNTGLNIGRFCLGPVGSALFTLPFTWAAKQTRQFISNYSIETSIKALSTLNDRRDRNYIIKAIIARYQAVSLISSYESHALITTLRNKKINTSKKWQALLDYLNDVRIDIESTYPTMEEKDILGNQSDEENNLKQVRYYRNNGKKLFNLIVDIPTHNWYTLRNLITNQENDQIISLVQSNQTLLTTPDEEGKYLLHQAIEKDNLDLVHKLLALPLHCDINTTIFTGSSVLGKTPLQLADASSLNKNSIIGDLLIQKNAADDTLPQRKDLQYLLSFITNDVLDKEGWGIWENHCPHGIISTRVRLEKYLKCEILKLSSFNIDSLPREQIRRISAKLIRTDFGTSSTRKPHIKYIYAFINNIGKNRPCDYAKLEKFVMHPSHLKMRNFNI